MTTRYDDPSTVEAGLLAWADGLYAAEAAVLLLLRACGGRFTRPGWPWIARSNYGTYFVDEAYLGDDEIGALSGGEQRLLRFVRSLLGGQPVDLSDAITGVDRATLDLILAALAHAGGSHQHGAFTYSDTGAITGSALLPPLHPWD